MAGPLCRYCGTPIAKRTRRVWLHTKPRHGCRDDSIARTIVVAAFPTTKAECHKLTNWHVSSVSKAARSGREGFKDEIDCFTEWDGESYVDQFFCTGNHAKLFAYASARAGHVMAAWQEATNRAHGK